MAHFFTDGSTIEILAAQLAGRFSQQTETALVSLINQTKTITKEQQLYLADGAKVLLITSMVGQPLTITLLLTMPSSKTPQQKSCIVLLDVTVARLAHFCHRLLANCSLQ